MKMYEERTVPEPVRVTQPEIGFVSALMGLVLEPAYTTEVLLNRENPPYVFSLFLALFSAIFVPMISQLYYYGDFVYKSDMLLVFVSVFSFTLMVFIVIEAIFFRLLGFDITLAQLSACVIYSLTPLTFVVLLVYLFNYLSTGGVSLITLLISGYETADDPFLRIVPYALYIGQAIVLMVFYCGIRTLGRMHWLTGVIVTVLSVIPYAAALFLGVLVGEIARPGTVDLFLRLVAAPESITYFQ